MNQVRFSNFRGIRGQRFEPNSHSLRIARTDYGLRTIRFSSDLPEPITIQPRIQNIVNSWQFVRFVVCVE